MQMRTLGALAALVLLLMAHCCLVLTYAESNADRESLQKTGEAIRTAFAQGDVDRIMAYHHPEVIKALSFHKYLVGRDAVAEDLRKTLQQFKLEFEENRVESLIIQGDTAIEQTVFAIRSTPKSGGESSLFRGRTQVVYVRYKRSPTGWASIREIIQPATD
jgi:ketosteroid isomerase-like protein